VILGEGKQAGGLWRYGVLLALLTGCADGGGLRQFLPKGAQDAALVFESHSYFTFQGCRVAAYKPRMPVELGGDYRAGPVQDAVGEMSVLYRIIGNAQDNCASPAEFGFSRNGYYALMKAASVQYKWAGGDEIVIFAPETGLFWVLTANI
jgi:hypothetical protein